MKTQLMNRPVEQVIASIRALDLESVKVRLMDPELGKGWTRDYADGIERGYRNYLTMLAKYQDHAEDILLSKDVDEFLHTHILPDDQVLGRLRGGIPESICIMLRTSGRSRLRSKKRG